MNRHTGSAGVPPARLRSKRIRYPQRSVRRRSFRAVRAHGGRDARAPGVRLVAPDAR
ncbi:MAG: hypothetical protein H0U81_05545 [Pyrinomonadaceae bacterium]|nr:hypothetical protein [Pyrinomonadaceae bacterium]